MSLDVRPFTAGDVDDAARLLAARHRAHRRDQPLLNPRYEDATAARAEIEAIRTAGNASGAAAYREGTLAGYLLGAAKPGDVWGPNVFVDAAGHAVDEAEIARDLYALSARRWVDDGATAHYVLLPAHDRALLDAWSRLAFGQQHIHAVAPATRSDELDTVVRPARRSDIPQLAELDLVLRQHLRASPVFSAIDLPTVEAAVAEVTTNLETPGLATFVAEVDGALAGTAIGVMSHETVLHRGLTVPDAAGELSVVTVRPNAQGRGLGRQLGAAVIDWTAAGGRTSVVIDWRVANLSASRTWPRLGFAPTFVRMHRLIGR